MLRIHIHVEVSEVMVPLYISVSEKNVLCIRLLPCASMASKNDPAKDLITSVSKLSI